MKTTMLFALVLALPCLAQASETDPGAPDGQKMAIIIVGTIKESDSVFNPSTVGQTALAVSYDYTAEDTPGAVIPRSKMLSILYPNLRCNLPIANAQNMKRAEFMEAKTLVEGCWGMILSPLKDEFVSVTRYGKIDSGSIRGYAKVKILADGSAKVIGPALSDGEYEKRMDEYMRAIR